MEDTTPLEEMLSAWFEAGLSEPESLRQMEQVVRERLLEIGRRAFERWLAAEAAEYPAARVVCECGGQDTSGSEGGNCGR